MRKQKWACVGRKVGGAQFCNRDVATTVRWLIYCADKV